MDEMNMENAEQQQQEGEKSLPSQKEMKSKQGGFSILLDYVEMFTICLCIIMLIFGVGIRLCSVTGESMMPTLSHGEKLLVSDIGYEPQQGDIIIFHQINDEDPRYNEPIVKRVIATGGQHLVIDFKNKTVTVDGVVLEEDYIQLIGDGEYYIYAEYNISHGIFDAVVPEGCLFVMGDNRNKSKDSRSTVIGFVDERRVLGKVILRLSPVSLFGSVE